MTCCPPGSWGACAPPADYVDKGSVVSLGANLRGYVVRPSSGDSKGKAIIAVQDIFGKESGRSKAICDDLAEKLDCLVVMPDFLENDTWPEAWGSPNSPWYNLLWFIPWLVRHNTNKTMALYESDIKNFLQNEKIEAFGMISFCWGALSAFSFSSLPEAKGHVGFHPSTKLFPISFGPSMEQTLTTVKCPQLLLVGKNDQVSPGDEVESLLRKSNQEVEVRLYGSQVHGWVNRGDVTKPEVAADVEKALNEACEFFKKNLIQ